MPQPATRHTANGNRRTRSIPKSDGTPTAGKGQVVSLADALSDLKGHPLFADIALQPCSGKNQNVIRITYRLGEPIVIGEPTFGKTSAKPGQRTPGIQRPDFGDCVDADGNKAWDECTKHNPLFIIKSGLVEVHHPCADNEESVPRAMLCHEDYFGEYELRLDESMPYRFSATAGFRTIVCWRQLLERPNDRPDAHALSGFCDGSDVAHLAHPAWAFTVFRNERAATKTTIYMLPQVLFLALARSKPELWERFWSLHIKRASATTALSEQIDGAKGVLAAVAKSTQPSARRYPGNLAKLAYALRAVDFCRRGLVPSLVPLPAYSAFVNWDWEFNMRLVYGSNWRTSRHALAKYPGACLFFVPNMPANVHNLFQSQGPFELSLPENRKLSLPLGNWWRCLTRKMLAVYTSYQAVNIDKKGTATAFHDEFYQIKGSYLSPPCVTTGKSIVAAVDEAFRVQCGLERNMQRPGSPRDDLFFY